MEQTKSQPATERFSTSVLDYIGDTPIMRLTSFETGLCELYVKMECFNPGGSIKDRIALTMIEEAEKSGKLKPGGTIIEATAGNTGLALALVAATKSYPMIVVIPDKMSQEKVFHLRAMGAKVVMTRSDVQKGHPEYYHEVAQRIADETPNSFYVNQFNNEANPLAHETTTGPEIWEQMGHDVDAVVCGVGSGGTVTGLSKFFGKVSPETDIVLADPHGSILADYIKTGELGVPGSWLIEGIGEDFIPPICDLSRVKHAYTITDVESFTTARALLKNEGILAGSSAGTLVAAALAYCREQTSAKKVVTFICDSGAKYLSKMFNDYWMLDQGFQVREPFNDLRDILVRKYKDGAVITVGPDEPLVRAYTLMKLYDISQLPVMENDEVIGLIDETDVLYNVMADESRFKTPLRQFMSASLLTIQVTEPVERVMEVINKGLVPMLYADKRFVGLITPIDLLNYMRRKMA